MLFPNVAEFRLTDAQAYAASDARLALRLHKTLAEIEAMPAHHYQQLVQVIEADEFIDQVRARRQRR